MSLTSFLKQKDVREELDQQFPKPEFGLDIPIQVEPRTEHYKLVGTAFDYLFRFRLQRIVDQVHEYPWIAEKGFYQYLQRHVSFIRIDPATYSLLGQPDSPDEDPTTLEMYESLPKLLDDLPFERSSFLDFVEEQSLYVEEPDDEVPEGVQDPHDQLVLLMSAYQALTQARKQHERSLEEADPTEDLFGAVLDLAKLDRVARSGGEPPQGLGEHNPGDVEDLGQLYQMIPESLGVDAEEVYLNPRFDWASVLVGGADADVMLDRTLLDVKTTMDLRLSVKHWRQLVGYAVLADLVHPEDETPPRPTTLGIYFARHGETWMVPAGTVYDAEGYEEFVQWLQRRAYETATESST